MCFEKKEKTMSASNIVVRDRDRMSPFSNFPMFSDWIDDIFPERIRLIDSGLHPIKVEEYATDTEIVVRAELPGINPDKDVEVELGDGYLTISGHREEEHKRKKMSEFYYGSFSRTMAMPAGVEKKDVKASYHDGILEVRVNRPANAVTNQRISIERK